MDYQPKIYSPKEILVLAAAIEKDEDSFTWLMENDFKELGALCDVLVYGKDTAMDWLKKYGFLNLEAFVVALNDDHDAMDFLMNHSCKEWSATACAVNDDTEAMNWLLKYNFNHFARLADTLKD